jgi:hypothetical protein
LLATTLEEFCNFSYSCSRKFKMANTLNHENRLKGETKLWAWKVRVVLLLEENDLKDYVKDVVPSSTDLVHLEFHEREVKEKQLLIESMKDH